MSCEGQVKRQVPFQLPAPSLRLWSFSILLLLPLLLLYAFLPLQLCLLAACCPPQ